MATRTAKVRINVPNPSGRIKLGMFADVSVDPADAETVVAIPELAVIDSGQRTSRSSAEAMACSSRAI